MFFDEMNPYFSRTYDKLSGLNLSALGEGI